MEPQPINLTMQAPRQQPQPSVVVYDPAMCCSTGVCGPSVDPELLRVVRDLRFVEGQGVKVERFNLAQEPGAFTEILELPVYCRRSGTRRFRSRSSMAMCSRMVIIHPAMSC